MELFLPGLVVILISAIIVFVVLPRIGAPILAILSVILLVYGLRSHYQLFASEYRFSTWQDQFKFYGPFVIIGALILGILAYIGFLFGTEGVTALPATNLPANAAVVEAANNAVVNISNTANKAVNAITNTITNALNIGPKNNTKINRGGIIENLAQILATPNRKPNNRLA